MNKIYTNENGLRLLSAESIASGASTTADVDLTVYRPEGFMTLQLLTTGSGTLKVEILGRINKGNYCTPNNVSDVVASHVAGDGLYSVEIGMAICDLRLKFTAASDTVVVDAWLLVQ